MTAREDVGVGSGAGTAADGWRGVRREQRVEVVVRGRASQVQHLAPKPETRNPKPETLNSKP